MELHSSEPRDAWRKESVGYKHWGQSCWIWFLLYRLSVKFNNCAPNQFIEFGSNPLYSLADIEQACPNCSRELPQRLSQLILLTITEPLHGSIFYFTKPSISHPEFLKQFVSWVISIGTVP